MSRQTLNNQGSGTLNPDVEVLATLPANVWTAYPAFPSITNIQDIQIYTATGENITEALDHRINLGQHEIRSLFTEVNLQFRVSGT